MQTKGKFYIWLNAASAKTQYWNKEKKSWTPVPIEASFFDDEESALVEASNASSLSGSETIVYQSARNI